MPQAVYTPLNADEEQKPADDKINGLLEHLKSEIEAKLGKLDLLKAIHYYSRAHGAPIHYVKVQVADEKFAHITIMEPRFGKTGPPTLSDVLPDRKHDDPVEAFGLQF